MGFKQLPQIPVGGLSEAKRVSLPRAHRRFIGLCRLFRFPASFIKPHYPARGSGYTSSRL